MKISEFLRRAQKELQPVSGTALLDAELMLSEVLQKPREFLCSRPEYLLSSSQKKNAGILLQKRLRGFPVAYILEKKEFYGLDFIITPSVLVPRPETEIMVEKIIPHLKNGGCLIDMGTGSGCIALSVAKNANPDIIFAVDISKPALAVAKKNAEIHNVTNITYKHSDFFQNFSEDISGYSPLIIAANLPYVPKSEVHSSIKKEPKTALFSGEDGLNHYRRFFLELQNTPFDICFFEFHSPQKRALEEILSTLFPSAKGEFFQDYADKWRLGMLKRIRNPRKE